jgi:hypothetical protein
VAPAYRDVSPGVTESGQRVDKAEMPLHILILHEGCESSLEQGEAILARGETGGWDGLPLKQ